MNLFLPQQKLISKTRHGATVTKRHDTPTTPLNRLLNHYDDMIDPHDLARAQTLRHDIDIANLKHLNRSGVSGDFLV